MPTLFVTLVGGPPWGFRIQGGRGTGLPLRLSKVNPDSKSAQQGLEEGDVLKMINGQLADGMNQSEVRDIIRDAGPALTLEIEREPIIDKQDDTMFTTTKTFMMSNPVGSTSVISPNKNSENQSPTSSRNNVQNQNGSRNNGNILSDTPSPPCRSPYSSGTTYLNGDLQKKFSGKAVITDEPPPAGAILIDQKVTIEGDKVHTDKYYALPIKEVLKEKTLTTKFIPAPSKYDGIGPTEEGIPVSLRQSVKKENMSDWYKTMFKTLHKVDNEDDTYVIGYTSDPEIRRDGRKSPKKLDLLESKPRGQSPSDSDQISLKVYSPPPKSPVQPYNVKPRPIEDYEPGFSSAADKEINTGAKRFHIHRPKHFYEMRDGYDSESQIIKKTDRPYLVNPEKQKIWYRQVQQGGEIPQYGLGIPAPEKPTEPVVGPPPLPSQNCQSPSYQQATRPQTLPEEYSINNNGVFQQANGTYETEIRNAIHNELRQQGFQVSPVTNFKSNCVSVISGKKMCARTIFNFVAESPREISLKKGDIVLIHRELDTNWYEGEHNGTVGIFPVNYVEVLPPEHASSEVNRFQEGHGKILYDFRAHSAAELPVKKGDEVHLIRRVDDNWYEGRIGSKSGIIPASYIQVLQAPEDKNQNSAQMLLRAVSPRSNLSSERAYSPLSSPTTVSPQSNGYTCRTKKGSHLIEPILYRALYKYNPQNADELELMEGDDIYIVEICDDGWYVGTSVRTGDVGIIPGNYMERV